MPIRLISDDDVREVVFDGTTFRYRRQSAGHVEDAVTLASQRGRLDGPSYQRELWSRIVAGWSGLEDKDGVEVEYRDDPEFVYGVVRGLPPSVKNHIQALATADVHKEHEASKNSEARSNN